MEGGRVSDERKSLLPKIEIKTKEDEDLMNERFTRYWNSFKRGALHLISTGESRSVPGALVEFLRMVGRPLIKKERKRDFNECTMV